MNAERFVLVDRASGKPVDVYMNVMAHHQMFFDSPEEARESNCHGIYKDKTKYAVMEVQIETVKEDVDQPTPEEIQKVDEEIKRETILDAELDRLGIKDPWERISKKVSWDIIASLMEDSKR